MMSVETKLMTADELLAMPDDGAHRYELVRGELVEMSPAGWNHGVIANRIARHLGNYVEAHNLGETPSSDTGYVVSRNPDTVFQPDASFVATPRLLSTSKFFPGAPDLAIEVISPSDTYSEVRAKVREYLRGGARMVIVIDADEQAATITTPAGSTELTVDDAISGGDVVPGWSLPLRQLFRR
jgi:Uma2 family endonuclease